MYPISAVWLKPDRQTTEVWGKPTIVPIPVKILAFAQETTGDQSNPVAIVLQGTTLRTLDLKELSEVHLNETP